VSIAQIVAKGFLVDDVANICSVSASELTDLEESASATAEGMLQLALAHLSRDEHEYFYGWLEMALSSHSRSNSPMLLQAVHLMAFSHQFLLGSPNSALEWYQLCLDMNESHKQCLIEAGRLVGNNNDEATSWLLTRKGLALYAEEAKFGSPTLPCSVAIQGARSALNACWSKTEELCSHPKLFLASYLIDIAEAVCDQGTLLFEDTSIISQLKGSFLQYFEGAVPPDPKTHCISIPPRTEDQIMDGNLLLYFYPENAFCEAAQEGSPVVGVGVDESASDDSDGTESPAGLVSEQVEPDRIFDHENDIDTPHSSKTQIQLLLLLETHRLTGWW